MATYLFTSPGGRDIQFKSAWVSLDNPLCEIRGNKALPTLNSPRKSGEYIQNEFDSFKEKIEYPILLPAIEYCINVGKRPDKIFLLVSDQENDEKDTLFFGEILKMLIYIEFQIICVVIPLQGNPSSFDNQYQKLDEYFLSIESALNVLVDSFYIYSQSGTPATRNALLLNCLQRFNNTIQLEKPDRQFVTEQRFPGEFKKQVINNSLPFAIKAYIAQILTRNYVHHIGSHVTNRVFFDRLINRFNIRLEDLLINSDAFTNIRTVQATLKNSQRRNIESFKYMLALKDNLDAYCQQRNEYIANLTSFPDLGGKTASLYRDIIVPLIENTLILDNIAASEKFYYSNRIDEKQLRIKVFIRENGKNYRELRIKYPSDILERDSDLFLLHFDSDKKVEAPIFKSHEMKIKFDESIFNLKEIVARKSDSDEEESGGDVEITLPGTLGAQALYSILENYLRNVAKHDQDKIGNHLDVLLYIDDFNDDYFKVYLTNTCSILTKEQFENLESNAKKAFEMIDRSTGNPIQTGAGILDMAINASLLGGIGDFTTKNLTDSLLIKKVTPDEQHTIPDVPNDILYYSFQLRKAKKVICLTEASVPAGLQKGIVFTGLDQNVLSGKFAVIEYYLIKDFQPIDLENLLLKLPFRVIVVHDESDQLSPEVVKLQKEQRIVICTTEEISFDHTLTIGKCWEIWLSGIRPIINKKLVAQLYLYFQEKGLAAKWKEDVKLESHDCVEVKIVDSGDIIPNLQASLPLVCFDHHGTVHEELLKVNSDSFSNENCYVVFGKNSSDYMKIANAKNNPEIDFELAEAGLMKVLVVDERIAQVAMKKESLDKLGIEYLWDYYKAANVWVATGWNFKPNFKPENSFDFIHDTLIDDANNFPCLHVCSETIGDQFTLKYEGKSADSIPNRFDMIIIHRTVLTDMIGGDDTKSFIDQLHKHFPFIIVNSGGGRPLKVKGNYKFLPYATLSRYFGRKEFAKYSFIQELMEI